MIKVPRYPNALDHLLAAIGCLLAVYSAGLSIGRPSIGVMMAGLLAGTSLVGAFVGHWVQGKRIANADGYLLFAAAIGALAGARVLNQILPEGGFPLQLIFAGVFSWMLVLGSLFAWRDATLCFLVVPCIAIFGLVGAFDTVRTATVFFFVFLVAAATLFFRSHARSMMDQAEAALGGEASARKRTEREVTREAMQTGAWKWMAGPEWALGSALVIVILSALGAPVIQQSVQGVAGQVRLPVPAPTQPRASSTIRNTPGEQPIGGGPASFLGLSVLKVKSRDPYLRGRTFDTYTGGGWASTAQNQGAFLPEDPEVLGRALSFPVPPESARTSPNEFEVQVLNGSHNFAYVPGRARTFQGTGLTGRLTPDGVLEIYPMLMGGMAYQGTALLPRSVKLTDEARLPEAISDGRPFSDPQRVPTRVRELAVATVAGASSDLERAQRIKSRIEEIAAYNLRAPAVPQGADPVEHFLFTSKQGYCDLFASAMVTMARSVGLPARVATGFLVRSPERDAEGFQTVKDEDAHMWAEIYFDGVGWVVFDATEGAVMVDAQGRREDRSDVLRMLSNRALEVLPWVLGGLAVLFGYLGLRRSAAEEVPPPRSEVGRLYARLQQTIERHIGRPRRLGQTPREFVQRAAPDLGDLAPQAAALTDRFEVLLYGPIEPSDDDVAALKREVDEFRRAERRAS